MTFPGVLKALHYRIKVSFRCAQILSLPERTVCVQNKVQYFNDSNDLLYVAQAYLPRVVPTVPLGE